MTPTDRERDFLNALAEYDRVEEMEERDVIRNDWKPIAQTSACLGVLWALWSGLWPTAFAYVLGFLSVCVVLSAGLWALARVRLWRVERREREQREDRA